MPLIPVRLIWAVGVEGDSGDKIQQLDVLLDDVHLDIPERRCVAGDGTYYADGDIATQLPAAIRLEGRIDVRRATPCVDLTPRTAGPTELEDSGTVFQLADLLEDGGIEYRLTTLQGDTLVDPGQGLPALSAGASEARGRACAAVREGGQGPADHRRINASTQPLRDAVRVLEQQAPELGPAVRAEPRLDAGEAERPRGLARRGRTRPRPCPSCPRRSGRG